MYHDTVTIFNRYHSSLGDMFYPTVLHNVNVNIDKAGIIAKYGESSKDSAILNVKIENGVIAGKIYLPPKEWAKQVNDELSSTITFAQEDFFMLGEYTSTSVVNDDDYVDGFYDYMNKSKDYVYMITSVSEFSVIPHLEITGK